MTDTNELRAKVERAVDAWDATNALIPMLSDFGPTAVMAEAARLWLAEHRPDDSAEVTEEWLRAVGFKLTDAHIRYYAIRSSPPFVVVFSSIGGLRMAIDRGHEVALADVLPEPTRADVRALCRALGIELKETP